MAGPPSDWSMQLLLTSLSAAPQDAPAGTSTALAQGLALLQQGHYIQALACSLKELWAAAGPSKGNDAAGSCEPECAPDWFDALQLTLQRQLGTTALAAGGGGDTGAALLPLLVAVAATYVFMEANLTGPAPVELPECPFDLMDEDTAAEAAAAAAAAAPGHPASGAGSGSGSGSSFGRDSTSPGDRWAVSQLCVDGEDAIGRISTPQYLLLAREVLLCPAAVVRLPEPATAGTAAAAAEAGQPAATPSAAAAAAAAPVVREGLPREWAWWAQRAVLLQQRSLAGRSATLRALLEGLTSQVLASLAPAEQQQQQQGSSADEAPLLRTLRSAALLEAALVESAYGYVEAAGKLLQRSCEAAGFRAELTGALGVRTVHQQDPKAQLLVRVSRDAPCHAGPAGHAELDAMRDASQLEAALDAGWEQADPAVVEDLKGLEANQEVLAQPQLVGQSDSEALPTDLGSLEQALLLALCTLLRKGSSSDALKPWEAAAYVEAVERQARSQFLLRCAARLQRVRFEKERVRTRERALLSLEQLAGALQGRGAVPPQERMRWAFGVWFPLAASLRKELGELLVAAGAVGSALALFESLELWDALAVCYQLLGKKVQAEELVRRRLEVTPGDPRLWCALGDLTLQDRYYLEAWERSGHRSARAQRSLARNAIRNNNWAAAAQHWEAALALNPLNPEGWFSLGFAYIKEKDYPKALQACSRCVQLDPTNGEAWNNLAAIHMHVQRWGEAFGALSEATKHKRDSWQTWENFADVAVKVGQWQVAVRALRQVLALSQGNRAPLGLLSGIAGEVERLRGVPGAPPAPATAAPSGAPSAAGALEEAGSGAGGQGGEHQGGGFQGGAAPAAEGPVAPAEVAPAEVAPAEVEGSEGLEALAQALASMRSSDGSSSSSGGGGGGGGSSAVDPGGSGSAGAGAQAQQAQQGGRDEAALAAAEAHARKALERAVGALLKEVAGTAAGDSAFWEVYARYYAACGYPEAARECLLKRVRALQGRGWSQEEEGFKAFATASLQLCKSYLEEGGARELSSARMHLRGLLKQAAERYGEHPLYADLKRQLEQVEERQQQQQQAK